MSGPVVKAAAPPATPHARPVRMPACATAVLSCARAPSTVTSSIAASAVRSRCRRTPICGSGPDGGATGGEDLQGIGHGGAAGIEAQHGLGAAGADHQPFLVVEEVLVAVQGVALQRLVGPEGGVGIGLAGL